LQRQALDLAGMPPDAAGTGGVDRPIPLHNGQVAR
jgi:hypothetical protein